MCSPNWGERRGLPNKDPNPNRSKRVLPQFKTKPKWPVWKFWERGGRRVVEKRVEGNGYPPPCLDVFKISKGEESN